MDLLSDNMSAVEYEKEGIKINLRDIKISQ